MSKKISKACIEYDIFSIDWYTLVVTSKRKENFYQISVKIRDAKILVLHLESTRLGPLFWPLVY